MITDELTIAFVRLSEGLEFSAFPITNAQFASLLASGMYENPAYWSPDGDRWRRAANVTGPAYWQQPGYDDPKQPVTGVNYYEAEAAVNVLNATRAGAAACDLPTEEEWAYACSNGGRDSYPWGADADAIPDTRANLGFFGALRAGGITPVDAFPLGRTAAGVWDMIGNCGEWVRPGAAPAAAGTLGGVLRGGCFWNAPEAVDCTYRDVVPPTVRDNQTGIRLVRRTGPGVSACPAAGRATVAPPRRPIARPSRQFRQEGIPVGLTPESWRLKVNGLVERPLELSLADLTAALPQARRDGLYVCVCRWAAVNEVAGVLLADLVAAAGPTRDPRTLYVRQRSVPGPDGRAYETTVPLTDAVAHDALICHTLDGRPLTLDLGWPARFWAFHLYAYKQVKCLAELTLTDRFEPGWWEVSNDYDPTGLIQPGRVTVIGDRPYKKDISGTGRVQ